MAKALQIVEKLRLVVARMLAARLKKLPRHVAIIPDGNRRWARTHGLPPWVGHLYGYLRLKRLLNLLWDLGVKYVTVYALSRENCLRRPRDELTRLFALLRVALRDLAKDSRLQRGELRVRFVGDLSLVPPSVRDEMVKLESRSTRGERLLTVGVCYSGRWEIVEAVRKLVSAGVEPSEETLSKLMSIEAPEPDLVIRTGGEVRISNFMLWHIAYSELYFTKKLWPDFDELELVRALLDYQARERRFGR